MSENAYWVDPVSGKIHKPKSRHIATVIKHPTKFGETDSTIERTFKKHNEPISTSAEGKAREEVMLRIIKRGYIRIRKGGTRRNQHWSIQIDRINRKVEDVLWMWANKVINDGTADDKYADVVIHEFGKRDKMTRTSLDVIASGASISEARELIESLGEKRYLEIAETDKIRIYTDDDLNEWKTWKELLDGIPFSDLSEFAQNECISKRV